MRSRRGNILVIILGILLFVSLFVAGYLYWQLQQPKSTETMITSTTKSGFFSDGTVSFQYPPDWKQTKQEKLTDQGMFGWKVWMGSIG